MAETRVNLTQELLRKLRCLCAAARATREDFRCSRLVHLENGLAEITDGAVLVWVRDEGLDGLPGLSVRADDLRWALRRPPAWMELRQQGLLFVFEGGGAVEIPLVQKAWPLTRKYVREELAPLPLSSKLAIHPRYIRLLAALAALQGSILHIGVGDDRGPIRFSWDDRRAEVWVLPLDPDFVPPLPPPVSAGDAP